MSNVKNVEAFEKLLGLCSGYGGYNPGKPNLTIQSLTNKLINAKQAVDDANVAKSNLDKESNSREIVFDALPRLASSIVYTLASSGASEQTLNDARFLLRQITGRRKDGGKAAPVGTVPTAAPATAPSPQAEVSAVPKATPPASYASKANHFANLVKLVSAEANYQPNEPELQVAGLTSMAAELQQMNSTVIQAQSNWNSKRIARDKALYTGDSLLKTSRSVQKYVRAAFGLRSQEYQKISKIVFTKPSLT
jgi:hypothetical protein